MQRLQQDDQPINHWHQVWALFIAEVKEIWRVVLFWWIALSALLTGALYFFPKEGEVQIFVVMVTSLIVVIASVSFYKAYFQPYEEQQNKYVYFKSPLSESASQQIQKEIKSSDIKSGGHELQAQDLQTRN